MPELKSLVRENRMQGSVRGMSREAHLYSTTIFPEHYKKQGRYFSVYVSGDGGKNWEYHYMNFYWGGAKEYTTNTTWNSDTSMNLMLAVTPDDSGGQWLHIRTGGN